MAASPSSCCPSPPPPQSTPEAIPEQGKVRDDEETEPKPARQEAYKHQLTPLHRTTPTTTKSSAPKKTTTDDNCSISCNKCRPSARDKISIVPLDVNGLKQQQYSTLSPSIIRSLFLSITRKSPRSSTPSSSSATATATATAAAREEEWKLTATELSRKLLHATRKRDEALVEASRLKYSVSELERKLDRLESYCHDLKTALDHRPTARTGPTTVSGSGSGSRSLHVESFLRTVADGRTTVRQLSRALVAQIRQGAAGPRAMEKIASLLQPHDPRAAGGQTLLFYMEALLNRVFYGEFEAEGEGAAPLDPVARCEANRVACEAVRGLGWDEVLSKGTRHYSEGLSRFCDRRMSEVVGMLGWARAWPEALLRAFFGAAKGAWVVHLLARSVHPPVPILRVERGAAFDPGYMEDVAGDRARGLVPAGVRMMVAPGFYVYSSTSSGVIKCKVLSLYNRSTNSSSNNSDTVNTNSDGKNKSNSFKGSCLPPELGS